QRVLEQEELVPPTQEREAARLGDCGFRAARLGRIASQLNQNFAAGRAARWIAPEKADAEPIEILGNPLRDLARRVWLAPLLLEDHLGRFSHEGAPAGQPLVQHHAQAVPVARL